MGMSKPNKDVRVQLCIWVDRQTAKAVAAECKRTMLSKSAFVRWAIAEKLAKGKP